MEAPLENNWMPVTGIKSNSSHSIKIKVLCKHQQTHELEKAASVGGCLEKKKKTFQIVCEGSQSSSSS